MAEKKADTITFEGLMRDIGQGQIKPVYLLMGDENYFMDQVSDAIVNKVLREDERDFNLHVFYGMDTDIGTVVNTARSFPMGADRSVVLLREAQHVKNLDELSYYMDHLQPATVLVVIYRNGTVDARKKLVSAIQKEGVVFVSQKPREDRLPSMIVSYLTKKGLNIDTKSVMVIAESIGADLNRLFGELDKLASVMPEGEKMITPNMVEEHIGISKDYNYFELQDALVSKNVIKANKIVNYFDKNPKAEPLPKILTMLFGFYSKCMLAYYSPDKSDRGVAAYLHASPWYVQKNIMPVLRNYNAVKVLQILDEIRSVDRKSKGAEGSKYTPEDLLKQLVFFILH